MLLAREEQITAWVAGGEGQDALSIVKIEELLARQGCVVPYRTLHRFAVERCGFRVKSTTVRAASRRSGRDNMRRSPRAPTRAALRVMPNVAVAAVLSST